MGILYITDWNVRGSGYFSIGLGLISALTKHTNETIIVLGMNYFGQEYWHEEFTVIPTEFAHIPARIKHLVADKELDIDKIIVALDIPLQSQLLVNFPRQQRGFRYIGILPLDGGPLVREWGLVIGEMDECFVISKFAQRCCAEAGLSVEYLPVVVSKYFGHSEPEFRERTRREFGAENNFIILTIADNQERKNLSGAMQMVAEFAQDKPDVEHWVVTRMESQYGWRLETLARELGTRKITHFFDRTLPAERLFLFYTCADVLLHTPKAEGLGLPVLEAQSVGAIPIATRCSAITELIEEGSGLFIEPGYEFIDPFGNTRRVFPSIEDGVKKLQLVYDASEYARELMRQHGRDAVDQRDWNVTAYWLLDILSRNRVATIGFRDNVPWYSAGYSLEVPDYTYGDEYIGR